MDVLGAIKSFVDKIFQPPIAFLDLAADKLQSVQLVTAQGLNIGQYFAVFGDLPTHFQLVVSSILLSSVLLGSLLMFRSVMRIYYSVKEGVKWW
ncbi:hypothetical protein [Virgibacillus sp. SK37]|uniref:hypothetical protein n=1 Tax=Virgibacillus sp. SK37 TaxID=403957 RepID=UPI0004D1236E|nr:hypothetical protein [Virgibacillus sp. SK37]AIF45730.1 hypothetical protein X953_19840 [Virgibacillus sp. SK37]